MNKFLSVFGGLMLVVLSACSQLVQAQTTTIYASHDAQISSKFPSNNYGEGTLLRVNYSSRNGIYRSAINFDLRSIPSDAQISSAKIYFLSNDVSFSNGTYYDQVLERIESEWTESEITFSNAPPLAEKGIDVSIVTGGWRTFDVTNDIRNMIAESYPSNGWMCRLVNEEEPNGYQYYSDENGDPSKKPYLSISYYMPIQIGSASITHASDISSTNGAITPSITGGSGSFSYEWMNGATGSIISTSSTLSGVGYGWYGLHITDNNSSFEKYMGFLVGVECSSVTIDFKPGPEYVDDALLYDQTINGIDNGNNNFGYAQIYLNSRWFDQNWFSLKTLFKFNLWLDSLVQVDKSDLYLYGSDHFPKHRSNVSELRYLSNSWDENLVTYNNAPNYTSSPLEVIPETSTPTETRVIDISDFWDLWKLNNSENYGILMQLQSDTNARSKMEFHSSDATSPTDRPWIQFEINLEEVAGCPSITPTWDADSETGVINVDITPFAGAGAPYQYIISKEPITELAETYKFIHDSLGFDIDSAQFFAGKENSQTYQFNGLDAGTYFVSVFDKNGERIFDRSKHVQGALVFDQQTGLTISGNSINATSANGAGSLKLYMNESTEYSSFETTLKSLSTSGEQFVGLSNSEEPTTDYHDLAFGFRVQGSSLYTVKYGVATSVTGTLVAGDRLKLSQIGNQLTLLKNGTPILAETLPATFNYKISIGTQTALELVGMYEGTLTLKQYRFIPTVTYFDCDGTTTPKFNFKLQKVGTEYWATANYSITNSMTGEFVSSGSISANGTTPNFTTLSNSTPLTVGYYTITITGLNNQTYTEEIYLGYPTEWETIDPDYATNAANSYSTLATNVINNNYLYAKSKNIMKPSEQNGFIEFTPLTVTATNSSGSLLRFTTENIGATPVSAPSSENFIIFYRQGTQFNAYAYIGNTPQLLFSLPINTTMKVRILPSTIEFKYGNVIQSYPRNGFTGIIRCQSNKNDFGFKNVISSFPCKEESDLYAKLKPELDGFYHIMKNGKIKFIFDQEYDTDDLTFNIYNRMDVLVRDQNDFPALSTTYGKNYLILDASTAQYCLGRGFFYLEVINSKKEKQYLRFFNDYTVSPCDDYIIADPNGPGN